MFDDLTGFMRQLKVYALGKGLLTLGVFTAAAIGAATGLGVVIPTMVVGIGGFALTVVRRLHSQSLYEENMLNLYRDNIAQQLGKAPDDVTRADLKEAAKDNDVIAHALSRQRKKTWLTIGTSALASIASVGLIMLFGFDQTLKGLASSETLGGILKPIAGFIGVGTVASISNLIFHEGLDAAIGYGSGIHKVAAHDMIYQMDLDIRHGRAISREAVFAVVVAADDSLAQRIAKQYSMDYAQMSQGQKAHVLHDLKLASTMDQLALAITDRKVRPGYLAYVVHDPRLLAPQATVQPDAPAVAPARGKSFVERVGKTAPQAASFAQRVSQQSDEAALAATR